LGLAPIRRLAGRLIVALALVHLHLVTRTLDLGPGVLIVETDQELSGQDFVIGADKDLADRTDGSRQNLDLSGLRLDQSGSHGEPVLVVGSGRRRLRRANPLRGSSNGDSGK